jgi:hypothetical protein
VFPGPDLNRAAAGRDACIASCAAFAAQARVRAFAEDAIDVHVVGATAVVAYRYRLD